MWVFRPAQRARLTFYYNGKRTSSGEHHTVRETICFANGKHLRRIQLRLSATLALSSTLHPVLDLCIAVLIPRRRRTSPLFVIWDLHKELVLLVLREWCKFAPFVIKLSRRSSKCLVEKITKPASQPDKVQIFVSKVSLFVPTNACVCFITESLRRDVSWTNCTCSPQVPRHGPLYQNLQLIQPVAISASSHMI